MAKKHVEQQVDPTLPYREIEVAGQTYKMTYTLGALALAGDALARKGQLQNASAILFAQLVPDTITNQKILFAASLQLYHPEVEFEEAQTWVTKDNLTEVFFKLRELKEESSPEEDSESPQEPGVESEP